MTNKAVLRQGTSQEIPLQASKWLQLQLLIDVQEMQDLFLALGDFHIYLAGSICPNGQEEVSHEEFIKLYAQYIEKLKDSVVPDEKLYRPYFSSVFTVDSDHVYQVPLKGDKSLVRIAKPIVQLQMNKIAYSKADGKFRAMVFSTDSFFWGLQFSYPQLYQDSKTKEVFHVRESEQFPNTALFNALKRWTRKATIPTPFLAEGIKTNAPMRLGKQCLPWINQHVQLKEKQIQVAVEGL